VDTRPEDIRSFMASDEYLPGGLLLVLSPEGSPCGTLRVEREHDDEPDSGFIGTISVDRERRGQGIGRALVRTALALSRRNGFRQAFLSVNADNKGPLALYLSEGFSLVKAMTCMEARI
jgi:ribosomal protein S18 acetylase RimI-like enzyme